MTPFLSSWPLSTGGDLTSATKEGCFCSVEAIVRSWPYLSVFVCDMLISVELLYKDLNWLAGTLHSTGHLQLFHQVHYLESCGL